jgi:cytoskeleton protein RodZ
MANSIGEQIKQARLKRGLTLEQVSQATHIRKHYLEALENDQREALPSPVQGRGFLRLYASHLDLPIAALLAAWDGKLPPEPPTQPVAGSGSTTTPTIPPAETDQTQPAPTETQSNTVKPPPVEPTPMELADADSLGDPAFEPGSSQAIFREIGQDLRKQRESLGLSKAEVERFTRLRQHYVQALEDGQIEQLPSPVQGRGMLSNYVAFLNMDEEKVLLRFAEGLQARRIERIPKPDPSAAATKKRHARQAPFWRRFLTPDLIFGVGVAAIILLFVLWTTARISTLRSAQSRPTPPGIVEVLLAPRTDLTGEPAVTPGETAVAETAVAAAAAAADTAIPGEPPTVTPVNDPNQDITPLVDATQTVTKGGQANPKSNVLTLTAPPVTTPSLAPINSDPLQVYIVAHQRAWLRITADDKLKFLGRTIPGNAYAFTGAKRIELLTGNAAAIEVYYNQTDLGVLGLTGQVVGLVFSPAGIATPTPAFTSTPTATLPATVTPLPSATPQATFTITPYVPQN